MSEIFKRVTERVQNTCEYAPVIIPTLCRYEHFKQCIESLSHCTDAEKTEVYVGLDYPAKESHWEGYNMIKEYLEKANLNFKALHIIKRERNYGALANSRELRQFVQDKYKKWIYSEDDNIFSPNFIMYMNMCLMKYKDDPHVFAVCGYTMPVEWKIGDNNHFATRYNRAWGYGSWENKFEEFMKCCNGNWLCDFLFDKKNAYGESFFQLRKNDYGIWQAALRHLYMKYIHYGDMMMYAYLLGANKFVICPSVTKVKNIGFDSAGMHYKSAPAWYSDKPIDEEKYFELKGNPYLFVEENEHRRRCFERIYNKMTLRNFRHRVAFFFKITLKVIFRGSDNRSW